MCSVHNTVESAQPEQTPRSQENRRAPKTARCNRLAVGVLLMLSGGSLFGACEMRLHDAFVASSQQVFFSFLDVETIVGGILGTPTDAGDEGL